MLFLSYLSLPGALFSAQSIQGVPAASVSRQCLTELRGCLHEAHMMPISASNVGLPVRNKKCDQVRSRHERVRACVRSRTLQCGTTHTWHLAPHTGKILPNRPKVDAYRHPGDRTAPPPRYQVYQRHRCFRNYQVAPLMPKDGSLVNRNKHFSISFFFPVWLPTSMGTWQGGTVAKRRYIQFCKNSCEYDIFIITNFLIGTSVIFFIIFYRLLRPF